MKIVITGAAGMLGQDVVRAAREVINCAAWTAVDGAEGDEAGYLSELAVAP